MVNVMHRALGKPAPTKSDDFFTFANMEAFGSFSIPKIIWQIC